MLSGGNQTDGNSLEIFLTPYQKSRLPLTELQKIVAAHDNAFNFGILITKIQMNSHETHHLRRF